MIDDASPAVPAENEPAKTDDSAPSYPFLTRVLVTGASGFVGRYVVGELVARGHRPVCLVRDRQAFVGRMRLVPPDRYEVVHGDLFDDSALARAAYGADAAIHLVGIIAEDCLRRQTFERVHFEGTRRVVDACVAAGVRRYAHMSALGTRADARSEYHRTKWMAENYVRASGLDWTIFRPSLIHGPDGEFMRMMKTFVGRAAVPALGFIPVPFPVIPYFGDGQARVQPVSVRDVAACFAACLSKPETIGRVYELGGPRPMTWIEMYRLCKERIPGAKRWKPIVGMPVPVARLAAATVMRLPILPKPLRFNSGQVQMSQEDSTCDPRIVEETFGMRMRDFEEELAVYAPRIGEKN